MFFFPFYNLRQALDIYEELERTLGPDAYSLTAVIDVLRRIGDWRRALPLLERLATSGLEPEDGLQSATNAILSAMAPANYSQARALAVRAEVEWGVRADVVTYGTLMLAASAHAPPTPLPSTFVSMDLDMSSMMPRQTRPDMISRKRRSELEGDGRGRGRGEGIGVGVRVAGRKDSIDYDYEHDYDYDEDDSSDEYDHGTRSGNGGRNVAVVRLGGEGRIDGKISAGVTSAVAGSGRGFVGRGRGEGEGEEETVELLRRAVAAKVVPSESCLNMVMFNLARGGAWGEATAFVDAVGSLGLCVSRNQVGNGGLGVGGDGVVLVLVCVMLALVSMSCWVGSGSVVLCCLSLVFIFFNFLYFFFIFSSFFFVS